MAYLALGQKSLESSDPCYIIGTDQLITMKYIQQLQLATLSQKLSIPLLPSSNTYTWWWLKRIGEEHFNSLKLSNFQLKVKKPDALVAVIVT